MKQRFTALTSLLLTVGLGAAAAFAAEVDGSADAETLEQTDSMSIARMLFTDRFYDRAAAVLEGIDTQDPTVDVKEYWLLRGLVDLRMERYAQAADDFGATIAVGNRAPKIYLLRAQAYASSDQLQNAARTLDEAPPETKELPESFVLLAQVRYKLGDKHGSFAALDEGVERFPERADLERQRMFLLMELGLYQAAQEAMKSFFAKRESKPEDYVALAEALRKGGQKTRARDLLEGANLRFPNHPDIRTQLAVTYLDLGHPVVAAEVLRPLAWLDAERAMHTAELYRKGGAYGRATRMNQRVEDQKAKFRQRLSLLLEQEQYEQAASLHARVARLGLLEEQAIVYAMAYAYFQIRDFDQAEALLSRLTDEKLFAQGIAIRSAIERCREAAWQCD